MSTNNKTGRGRGEARLYISSQNCTPIFTFSEKDKIFNRGNFYSLCNSTCYLIKENLIEYLESTYNYYLAPIQNHNRNIMQNFLQGNFLY